MLAWSWFNNWFTLWTFIEDPRVQSRLHFAAGKCLICLSLLCKHTSEVSGPDLVTVSDLWTPRRTRNYAVQNSAIFWKGLPALISCSKMEHIDTKKWQEGGDEKVKMYLPTLLRKISGIFQIMLLPHLTWT